MSEEIENELVERFRMALRQHWEPLERSVREAEKGSADLELHVIVKDAGGEKGTTVRLKAKGKLAARSYDALAVQWVQGKLALEAIQGELGAPPPAQH